MRRRAKPRSVLLGGREGLRVVSWKLRACLSWLPVLICLCIISGESTDTFSAAHTSIWIRHLAEAILGPITQSAWERVHHILRKTGHFVGYGLVGLCWQRAWLLTWRSPLRRSVQVWHRLSAAMALLCTLIVATVDELHQTYIPSRTGLMSDAWLDTAGAALAMALVALAWFGPGKPMHTAQTRLRPELHNPKQ